MLIVICIFYGVTEYCKVSTAEEVLVEMGIPVAVAERVRSTAFGPTGTKYCSLENAYTGIELSDKSADWYKNRLMIYVDDDGAKRSLAKLGHWVQEINRIETDTWYVAPAIFKHQAVVFLVDSNGKISRNAKIKWTVLTAHMGVRSKIAGIDEKILFEVSASPVKQ